jgi:hypothetical protein
MDIDSKSVKLPRHAELVAVTANKANNITFIVLLIKQ